MKAIVNNSGDLWADEDRRHFIGKTVTVSAVLGVNLYRVWYEEGSTIYADNFDKHNLNFIPLDISTLEHVREYIQYAHNRAERDWRNEHAQAAVQQVADELLQLIDYDLDKKGFAFT